MNDFDEWCDYECDDDITNREYINKFIDQYLKWIFKQTTISGNETRSWY